VAKLLQKQFRHREGGEHLAEISNRNFSGIKLSTMLQALTRAQAAETKINSQQLREKTLVILPGW